MDDIQVLPLYLVLKYQQSVEFLLASFVTYSPGKMMEVYFQAPSVISDSISIITIKNTTSVFPKCLSSNGSTFTN